jgi:heme exporter protein D
MLSSGFQQDEHTFDDGGARSVDWTNAALLQNAIFQGPVKIGVAADQLNNAYTGGNGWFATGFQADSNEDHCVSLCGYGTMVWLAQQLQVPVLAGIDGTMPGYAMFTWNSIGIIDVPSLVAITHEAWLRLPTTVVH